MTVFNTAYDTTAGKGFPTIKIVQALEEVIIKYNFHNENTGINSELPNKCGAYLLANQYQSFSDVPFFIHPILVDLKKINKTLTDRELLMVTDVRPFVTTKMDSMTSDFFYKNKMEFDLARMRTVLNMVWINDDPKRLRDMSSVPVSVYASWISEGISRRFALDPKDQMQLSILAGIFYYSLFTNDEKFNDTESMRVIGAVAKATKTQMKDVMAVMDQIEKMTSIKDFVAITKTVLQNTRLQDLNEGLLISILNTSWFGSSAKEVLSVAIEHPPTWLAIVYSSFVERSYRNSAIAKISERYALNKGQNDFVRSLVSSVQNHLID